MVEIRDGGVVVDKFIVEGQHMKTNDYDVLEKIKNPVKIVCRKCGEIGFISLDYYNRRFQKYGFVKCHSCKSGSLILCENNHKR